MHTAWHGARRRQLELEKPGLFAARHVGKGVGKAVLALIGIGVVLRFLPAIPLPDLPRIPLPSIDLPEIPWPDLPDLPAVPGWIAAIVATAKIWGPILAGLVLAVREYRRHRARRAQAALSAGSSPRPSTSSSTATTSGSSCDPAIRRSSTAASSGARAIE